MKFDYNGVCRKCGCGTTGAGESKFQSNNEFCFGCGTRKWLQPREDKEGNVIFSKGRPIMVDGEEKAFGTCLTKDYKLITFIEKPSRDRIMELKEDALSLVLWNEENEWLDVIVGSPLMRKDVILLESDYSIKEYICEPNHLKKEENTSVSTNENISVEIRDGFQDDIKGLF